MKFTEDQIKVHAFWYVVDALSRNSKVRLDRDNIEALEQRA